MTKIPDKYDSALALAAATRPLLEMFAELDAVFTEPEALGERNRQTSLGRCYRAWKAAKMQIDPDYTGRKISAKVGNRLDDSADTSTTMSGNARIVLRPRRRRKKGQGKGSA